MMTIIKNPINKQINTTPRMKIIKKPYPHSHTITVDDFSQSANRQKKIQSADFPRRFVCRAREP